MSTTCPRCSRSIADSTNPGESPAFCMHCGQRLKAPSPDDTVVRPVQPAAVSTLLSAPPDDADDFANTRSGHADSSAPDPVPANGVPTRVGGYRLVKFLGGGGMGNVYEAEDPHTGTRVAVKLLSRRLSSSPQSVERFRQEGRLASQLSHPRCVFVLRADTDNGQPFIVMELMPGRTLKDEVDARGRLPIADAIGYMLDVIDGLIEAHRLGVIHRDVKPSNCFLTADGRVKVGDFGLSKSLAGDTAKQLTHSGTFLGTVLFAPPEQIRHEPVGYDSDVYAVAATLYYLLLGQAPHQHDSLTAVLAKAISEPAPPLRPQRADVPKELEKVVLKGLERDRTRRYQTLEEMRDALADQLPQNQTPAGVRALVLAYLVDYVVIQAVLFPLVLGWQILFSNPLDQANQLVQSVVGGVASFAYFALFEGVWAATPGKFLFRLRVRRVGKSGPPGLGRACLRTLVFNAVWWVPVLLGFGVAAAGGIDKRLAAVVALPGLAVSFGVILVQLRKTPLGHRGVHDLAAGTRVVQKRLVARRSRLVSVLPNPLDRVVKSSVPLPDRLGLFKVGGKLCDVDDGGQVWVGEDESLGRRLILRVEPPGAGDDSRFDEPVVRPSRLRAVGHGLIEWGGGERAWVAYVAPAGAPLPDVVSPQKPLNWADTREVLEQVVGELADGERDGTAPPLATPEQVWVEPSGRVQVLDFPLPTGREPSTGDSRTRYPSRAADPFLMLRSLTTLMLEGTPRTDHAAVAAPLPSRAADITTDLMDDRFDTLAGVQAALAENRQHPAEVTTGLRAGHISTTGVLNGVWLALMFMWAGFVSFFVAFGVSATARDRAALLDSLDTPEERQQWIATARTQATDDAGTKRLALFEKWLADDRVEQTLAPLKAKAAEDEARRQDAERRLIDPERALLEVFFKQMAVQFTVNPANPHHLREVDAVVNRAERPPPADEDDTGPSVSTVARIAGLTMALLIAQWPLFWWPLSALVFRGGIARLIAGVAHVRKDGRPASVWVCWLRALLTWLPLLLALWLVIGVQVWLPTWAYPRAILWLLTIGLLPLMAVLALRRPDRSPIDRLLGTHIVPA